MFFFSKLLWMLFSPASLVLLLLLAGTSLLWTRRGRIGRLLVTGVACAGLLVSLLPLGEWSVRPLETRFPAVTEPIGRIDGIIVLGGSEMPLQTAAWGQPSLSDAAERLIEFVALARRHPDAILVKTGGSGLLFHPEATETETDRAVFERLGLDPARVMFESESRNTYENALYTKRLVEPRPGQVWLLVTSARHMPRAVGCFRAVGWDVLPYPVDYTCLPNGEFVPPGLSAGMYRLEDGMREWMGLAFYRLSGLVPTLFPGP